MASRNQYRLEICTNRLGLVWLRLKPPRGGEIILSGEMLSSKSGARRTANRMSQGLARGVKVIEVFEGPKDFEEPKA